MIALLLAAAPVTALAWQGRAVVHDGARTILIGVDTRMEADGTVRSASWPTALGREKGLRAFVLAPGGTGTIRIGDKERAAPADFVREEQAQFGFYRQMQLGFAQCRARPGERIEIGAPGPVRTAFRCNARGEPATAANWVAGTGTPVRQDFAMRGWWREGGAVFPRSLVITRDAKPFFDLIVTRFRAR